MRAHKALSLLLVMAMCLSLLPVAAVAGGEPNEEACSEIIEPAAVLPDTENATPEEPEEAEQSETSEDAAEPEEAEQSETSEDAAEPEVPADEPAFDGADSPVSGVFGDNFTWKIEDGVLTISGTGPMPDFTVSYPKSTAPWFTYSVRVTRVVIESGVTAIGDYAFYNHTFLQSISIPNGVTRIGDSALNGCRALSTIVIPAGVESIGSSVFEGTRLTNITIGEGLKSIGRYAFSGCALLETIKLPESLADIGNGAFYRCEGLTSITIPKNVTDIGVNVFDEAAALKTITVVSGNTAYASKNGILYTKDMTTLIRCPEAMTGSVSVPAGVQTLADYAFFNCTGVTGVTLPSGLTGIGRNAFDTCTALAKVNLPNTLTVMGREAFLKCSKLTSVTIPGTLAVVPELAFDFCSALKTVVISSGVREICSAAFYGIAAESVTIPGTVKSVEGFARCEKLKSVVLESGVLSISGFTWCTSLTEITLPDSVQTIGEYSFQGDEALKTVRLGLGITEIGSGVFNNCSSLTDVYYAGTETSWDGIVFGPYYNNWRRDGSVNLHFEGKEIPATVEGDCGGDLHWRLQLNGLLTVSGTGAMEECAQGSYPWSEYADSISRLTVEPGVSSIGAEAFRDCVRLFIVELPVSLTSIGGNAFYGCESLKGQNAAVSFAGTEALWSTVSLCSGNEALIERISYAVAYSGVTENGIEWCFENGALTFTGEGELLAEKGNTSWHAFAEQTSSVVIGEGITSVSSGCFDSKFQSVYTVTVPVSLTSVEYRAFYGMTMLQFTNYAGTPEQWYDIAFDSGNEPLLKACPLPLRMSGSYGGYTWDFTDGVFTVNGSGVVDTSLYNRIPNQSLLREQVTKIVFGEGITEIDCAPCGYNSLTLREICIPRSLTYISQQAWSALASYNGPTVTYAGTHDEFFQNIVIREGNGHFILCYDPTVSLNVSDYTVERTWTEAPIAPDGTRYNQETLRVIGSDGHVLRQDIDYTLYHTNVSTPGEGTVDIIGKYCYYGIQSLTYTLLPTTAEWRTVDGVRYYLVNDVPVTGLNTIGGALYWFDTDGAMQTGWRNIGYDPLTESFDGRYYFTEKGALTGLQEIDGERYLFGEDGKLRTGWQTVEGKKEFFDRETGAWIESASWTLSGDGVLTFYGTGTVIADPDMPSPMSGTVKRIVVEEGVTGLSEGVFYGYGFVESVSLAESVQSLGDGVFGCCTSLREVELPDGITAIPDHTFEGCASLARVYIPSSVTRIGLNAFADCTALKTVDYPGTDEQWNAIEFGNNNAFLIYAREGSLSGLNSSFTWTLSADGTLTVSGVGEMDCVGVSDSILTYGWSDFGAPVRRIVVEEGVTTVGRWAFQSCRNAESVSLPESLTEIEELAFAGCAALKEIIIPAGIARIAYGAFQNCFELKTVVFSGSEEQWRAIGIEDLNEPLLIARIGAETPAAASFYLREGLTDYALHALRQSVGLSDGE